jgi:hypothetical protein
MVAVEVEEVEGGVENAFEFVGVQVVGDVFLCFLCSLEIF